MKNILKYIIALMLFTTISCQEEGREDYIESSGGYPEQISNIQITPTAGGGIVKYDIPNDKNFLYAKAVYEAPKGVIREAKSSKYENVLVLEGYGDTEEHTVKFYSVSKNDKSSEPKEVNFTPLRAAIFEIAENIEINSAFGGVQINYENLTESNIIIEALVDTIGTGEEFLPLNKDNKLYTRTLNGRWVIRGLESVPTNFGFTIRDPFGNKTELIKKTLTPLFEIEVPKNNFADLRLPGDATPLRATNPITQLWDGVYDNYANFYATDQSVLPMPKWISLDFGGKYVLSRLKMWQRNRDEYTGGRIPTDWEVYGSNAPNPDGSFDSSWVLLQKFGPPEKPSGLPFGERTNEDVEFARKGFDYEFDAVSGGYRYYRFKWYEVQDFKAMVLIGEISFWGQEVQ
ncbi:DUF5000 domain-containing lipoprotein [Wenyingzhuangia sp. IMCC45467]